MPGSIVLDNTYGGTAGIDGTPTSGFITKDNLATYATTANYGVSTTGALSAGTGITIKGITNSATLEGTRVGSTASTTTGNINLSGIASGNAIGTSGLTTIGNITATTGDIVATGTALAGGGAGVLQGTASNYSAVNIRYMGDNTSTSATTNGIGVRLQANSTATGTISATGSANFQAGVYTGGTSAVLSAAQINLTDTSVARSGALGVYLANPTTQYQWYFRQLDTQLAQSLGIWPQYVGSKH